MAGGLVLAAGLLFGLRCFLIPISNPDLFWHLNAARQMLLDGAFPRVERWSHTMAGRPWLDFEWLTQMIYLGVHQTLGVYGLVGLRLSLIAAAVAAVVRLARLRGCGPKGQGLAALAVAMAILPFGDLRPDNFSLAAFAWLLVLLETGRATGRAPSRRALAATAAGFAVWVNLHLGFVYGLLLLAAHAAGEFLDGRRARARALAALLAASTAATLLNPYGWRVWTLPLLHLEHMDVIEKTICEWLPSDPTNALQWPFFGLLLASAAALIWRWTMGRRAPWALALGWLGFGALSLQHSRQITYFALYAVPALAAFHEEASARARARLASAAAVAFGGLILLSARVPLLGPGLTSTAAEPAAFLAEHSGKLSALKLYNTWDDGGYLGWALGPSYPIFIDGRYVFHEMLAGVLAAAKTPEGWKGYLRERGIELACIRRSEKNREGDKPYFTSYMPRRDWALVHWDAQRLVFVKRAAVDARWLAAREFRYLRPDGDDADPLPKGAGAQKALRAELTRVAVQAPSAAPEAARLAAARGML